MKTKCQSSLVLAVSFFYSYGLVAQNPCNVEGEGGGGGGGDGFLRGYLVRQ